MFLISEAHFNFEDVFIWCVRILVLSLNYNYTILIHPHDFLTLQKGLDLYNSYDYLASATRFRSSNDFDGYAWVKKYCRFLFGFVISTYLDTLQQKYPAAFKN